jgi:uncharacterized protein YjbI with pentapeptide repeats
MSLSELPRTPFWAKFAELPFHALDLQGADLRGANLADADLQGAHEITQDQIESTIGSSETKLPEGLDHPESWSKGLREQKAILDHRQHRQVLQERINRAE